MKTECKSNQIKFQDLGLKNVIASFDGGNITSDAGALILREIDRVNNFIKDFSSCFSDYRNQELIEHKLDELLKQRIFGICLGYEDLNDHDELRHDPLLATICEKNDPLGNERKNKNDKGKALAGKSTLNRLELSPTGDLSEQRYKKINADFDKIENYFTYKFLQTYPTIPSEIIIDVDTTDDLIHGNQEGKYFHGYYGNYCYLPLYIFCENYLLAAKLRPCNIDASQGTKKELERIISQIRQKWPNVQIIIRGDAGFCRDKIMSWCEENHVDYIFGLAKNNRLLKKMYKAMKKARAKHYKTGVSARYFKDFKYKPLKTWAKSRRVVGKAEHLKKGENPRFVVTSLSKEYLKAKKLYEKLYCSRGDMENRIKEQQLYLFADRTSTATMRANQLRLWFSCLAYLILNEIRNVGLKGTKFEKYQCNNIRLKILKIGAEVKVSVRRVYVSLSESYPYKNIFYPITSNIKRKYPLLN
ncbi:MAG: IS1380 family transposase [Clostridiaceae bacterium]|nr:IS1380 family transposase [Clostridiaceae bacterium]